MAILRISSLSNTLVRRLQQSSAHHSVPPTEEAPPVQLVCNHLVLWLVRDFASASLASRSSLKRAVSKSCFRRPSCELLSAVLAPTGGFWRRLNISSACWRVLETTIFQTCELLLLTRGRRNRTKGLAILSRVFLTLAVPAPVRPQWPQVAPT